MEIEMLCWYLPLPLYIVPILSKWRDILYSGHLTPQMQMSSKYVWCFDGGRELNVKQKHKCSLHFAFFWRGNIKCKIPSISHPIPQSKCSCYVFVKHKTYLARLSPPPLPPWLLLWRGTFWTHMGCLFLTFIYPLYFVEIGRPWSIFLKVF